MPVEQLLDNNHVSNRVLRVLPNGLENGGHDLVPL
jgi:hypothetical protein